MTSPCSFVAVAQSSVKPQSLSMAPRSLNPLASAVLTAAFLCPTPKSTIPQIDSEPPAWTSTSVSAPFSAVNTILDMMSDAPSATWNFAPSSRSTIHEDGFSPVPNTTQLKSIVTSAIRNAPSETTLTNTGSPVVSSKSARAPLTALSMVPKGSYPAVSLPAITIGSPSTMSLPHELPTSATPPYMLYIGAFTRTLFAPPMPFPSGPFASTSYVPAGTMAAHTPFASV